MNTLSVNDKQATYNECVFPRVVACLLLAVIFCLMNAVTPTIGNTEELPSDSPPVLRLTVNEALALFLKQNLDLLIAQFGIDSAKGQQITAQLFPNPVLNMGTMSSFTMGNTLAKSSELWANVQQLFEVAGKRGYRIESAKYGTESAEAAFEDAIRQLNFTVKDSYFHVQAAKRHLEIAQQNRDRFTRILDVNTIRFKKGFISGVDLIRIRLQVVDFDSTVIQSSQDLESALNDLRVVLALPPDTALELVTELEFHRIAPELPGLQQMAADRPDILVKRLTVSQRTAEFKLARALRYPDPSFGPGFTIQGPKGPDNPQQYTLGLSIPLPVFNRNQGGIVQGETAIRMAEADLRKTLIQAKNDVNVAFKTLVQSRRLVEVYQAGVLDDAKSSFSIIDNAYQRGGATILDLLDAARTAAAVQLNYIDALGMYQRNIFQLESAVGKNLTTNHE
jgi:cobalt-zinc-cadmium efflux system outer membrane protein